MSGTQGAPSGAPATSGSWALMEWNVPTSREVGRFATRADAVAEGERRWGPLGPTFPGYVAHRD